MCIGLQWSGIFFAEFIAPTIPSLNYKKTLVSAFNECKIHGKKEGTPPTTKGKDVGPTARGIEQATPSWRFVRHFVFSRHRRDSFFDWATGSPIKKAKRCLNGKH